MTLVSPVEPPQQTLDHVRTSVGNPANADRPREVQRSNPAMGFGDFLDVINPLQHIPVVSNVYRAVTNDQISDSARYAGHALYGMAFGGPIGLGAMLGYSVGETAVAKMAAQPGGLEETPSGPAPAPESSEATIAAAVDIPVPGSKPDDTGPAREINEVLGAEIGRTSEGAVKPPVDLMQLLSDTVPSPREKPTGENPPGSEDRQNEPAVSPEQKLDAIAAHGANHLPLEVLKVLQKRHVSRTHAEQS
ncbi:hypothetical protein JM93_00476 [Roseibium hamelinense]|uniref:Uncharacterized protein n=1 Tax=Roseibium hamelinense TaxID=150831 RepID=A0A562TI39_9HYPH|nr:hypothetical protein [Roseibium hamelinense]MTI45891.1 hypothetical protein [Roseibium hamelinense]TWI92924.1 hypothetical protein JM93_00476 [Roseibium hamelinense]